jgi:hypothetical protein
MNPDYVGIICFTEIPKKACFLKELRENKYNPKGSFKICKVLPMGSLKIIPLSPPII